MVDTRGSASFVEHESRVGGFLWLIGTLQFVVAMVITELGFGCSNVGGCYNPWTNPISDLGSAGFAGSPASSWPTSPFWPLFNYSIVVFGALLVVAVFRLTRAFPPSKWTTLGLSIFGLAGFGAAGVGVVAEDTILAVHSAFALVAFAGAGLALLAIAPALTRDPRWGRGWWAYTLASGLFSIAVTLAFTIGPRVGGFAWAINGSGFGYGGMERLIIVAPLLWLILAGAHIFRWPTRTKESARASTEPPVGIT